MVGLRRRRLVVAGVTALVMLGLTACGAVGSAGSTRTLQAIDPQTGDVLWTETGGRGYWGLSGTVGDLVVAVEGTCKEDSQESAVLGFDARTGRQRWRSGTRGVIGLAGGVPSLLSSSVGLSPRALVWAQFSGDELDLRGIDPVTGRSLWTRAEHPDDWYPLGGNRDVVIVGPHPNTVDAQFGKPRQMIRALDRRTGDERWKRTLATEGARTVRGAGFATDTTIVVNVDNRLWGLDPRTGEDRWTLDLPVPEGAYNQAWLSATPGSTVTVTQDAGVNQWLTTAVDPATGGVISTGDVGFYPGPDGSDDITITLDLTGPASGTGITARDTARGAVLWTRADPEITGLVFDDTVAVIRHRHTIDIIDAPTGALIATHDLPPDTRQMELIDGRLYLAGGC